MPEATVVRTPFMDKSPLHERFMQFNRIQQTIIRTVLNEPSPQKIGENDPGAFALKTSNDLSDIQPSFIVETGTRVVRQYVELEKRINDFESDHKGPGHSSVETTVSKSLGIQSQLAVRRIHGGYAVVVAPEEFQRYLKLRVENADHAITSPDTVVDQVINYQEMGYLLDQSEITKLAGLPAGVHIAIIADTGYGQNSISSAISHEEGEIIGQYFDEAIATDPFGKVIDKLARINPQLDNINRGYLRQVGYNIAAHLEQGHELNLARIGITAKDGNKYPVETRLLKSLIDKINTLKKQGAFSDTYIANLVRGGSVRIENLLTEISDKDETGEIIEAATKEPSTPLATDDEIKDNVFRADSKKGRFVYTEASYSPDDVIVDQQTGLAFKIIKRAGLKSGQGAGYMAYMSKAADTKFATKQMVFVKELLVEAIPDALLDARKIPQFVDDLARSEMQGSGINQNACKLLQDFSSYFKARRGEPIAVEALTKLDELFADHLKNDLGQNSQVLYQAFLKGDFRHPSATNPAGLEVVKASIIRFYQNANQGDMKAAIFTLQQDFAELADAFKNEYQTLKEIERYMITNNVSRQFGVGPRVYALINDAQPVTDRAYHRRGNLLLAESIAPGQTVKEKYDLNRPDGTNAKPTNVREALDLMIAIANTAALMHRVPTVHKDIKPDNIFIELEGNLSIVTFIDYGAAKMMLAGVGSSRVVTAHFAANEQTSQKGRAKPTFDVHAIGMFFYNVLTGDNLASIPANLTKIPPVVDKDDHYNYLNNNLTEDRLNFADLRLGRSSLSPAQKKIVVDQLAGIILKATAFKPEDRYQDCAEMVSHLMAVRENFKSQTQPLTPNLPQQPSPQDRTQDQNLNKDQGGRQRRRIVNDQGDQTANTADIDQRDNNTTPQANLKPGANPPPVTGAGAPRQAPRHTIDFRDKTLPASPRFPKPPPK